MTHGDHGGAKKAVYKMVLAETEVELREVMDATANSNNVGDENLNEDMNDTLGEDPLPSLPGLESAYIEQASGGGGGGGEFWESIFGQCIWGLHAQFIILCLLLNNVLMELIFSI